MKATDRLESLWCALDQPDPIVIIGEVLAEEAFNPFDANERRAYLDLADARLLLRLGMEKLMNAVDLLQTAERPS